MRIENDGPVVVAGMRIGAALRRAIAREQALTRATVWRAPDVLGFGEWLTRITQTGRLRRSWPGAERFRLTAEQTRTLWSQVIGATPELVTQQVDSLVRFAGQAHALVNEWQLQNRLPERAAGAPEYEALIDWTARFQARCAALGAIAEPDLVAAAVAAGVRGTAGLFCGFSRSGPAFRALGVLPPAAAPQLGGYPIRQFNRREEEFGAAFDWALAQRAGGRHRSVAVVLPDAAAIASFAEQALRYQRAAGGLEPQTGPLIWGGVAGIALADTQMVRHALALLGLASGLERETAAALVQSPYLAAYAEEAAPRARLAATLLEQKKTRFSGAELSRLAAGGCPQLARRMGTVLWLAESAPATQNLQAWMVHAQKRLKAAGWPGERATTHAERAAHDALARAFDVTASLDAVSPAASAAGALSQLRAVVKTIRVTRPAVVDAIELLTLEEAAALRPAAVWVMNLNDGRFPPMRVINPLLPPVLLRDNAVPGSHPTHDQAFARSCLAQIAAQAEVCELSCASLEDDTPLRPVAGLGQVIPATASAAALAGRWRTRRALPALEAMPAVQAVPLSLERAAEVKGGSRVLTDQALCPFKAFATHRLRATGLELKTPGPDPQDRGNLVHGALAAFWQHLNGQAALLALSDAALTLAIDRAVTTALDALAEINGRVRELEHARLVLVMREWLAFERQRVPFEVEEVESERRLAVGALEFSLRIDRIDRLAGDRLLILDYKTGKTARNEWDLPRPTAPQLLLYALAEHPAPVAAIGFARVHRAESQLMLLPKEADKAAPETALEDSLAQWRSALTALAEEYMAGEARVDPKDRKTTCRYCELALLCRIREQADTSEEDSDDDA